MTQTFETADKRATQSVLWDRGMYGNAQFLGLSAHAQLALHVLKAVLPPSGIAFLPEAAVSIRGRSSLTLAEAEAALEELAGRGGATEDVASDPWIRWDGRVVWLINGMRHERNAVATNWTFMSSIINTLGTVPKGAIYREFMARYGQLLSDAQQEILAQRNRRGKGKTQEKENKNTTPEGGSGGGLGGGLPGPRTVPVPDPVPVPADDDSEESDLETPTQEPAKPVVRSAEDPSFWPEQMPMGKGTPWSVIKAEFPERQGQHNWGEAYKRLRKLILSGKVTAKEAAKVARLYRVKQDEIRDKTRDSKQPSGTGSPFVQQASTFWGDKGAWLDCLEEVRENPQILATKRGPAIVASQD